MTVEKAQSEISSREFAEWIVFENMNPGLLPRLSILFGFMTYKIVGALTGKPGQFKEYIIDFEEMLREREVDEQSVEVKMRVAQQLISQFQNNK